MLCQIRKGLWGSASVQVVRARAVDEDQTSQWSGDQLWVPRRPGTHHAIKTLLDWIDETIRRAQLEFDLGMRLQELGQMRNHIQTRYAAGHVHSETAPQRLAALLEHRLKIVHLGQQLLASLVVHLAIERHLHLACGAVKQPRAERVLEFPHGDGDSRF